jgi:3-hydroxyisobutyrate dehydrogenase/glyoxylate/succinic semialdehyde reductase
MNVGFVGLGIMGSRMAANILSRGYSLAVFNRTRERATALLADGATWFDTPAELAVDADVVITMLSDPDAVSSAALGPDGLLHRLRPGAFWINTTTVNPSFARMMESKSHARGVRYLDAPVSGSREPAARGELLFMVGADAADLEACRPLMLTMGNRIAHVGGAGFGSSLKMINNLIGAVAMAGFAEGAALGGALGISPGTIFDVMTGGPMLAPFIATKRHRIESLDFDTEFSLRLLQKDLHLASVTAYESGAALPVVNAAKEVYRLAARAGYSEVDFSALYAYLLRHAD